MTKVDLQYDLVNYTPASASPPQANFSRIEQHVNQELIERDGTVAMRAQLKLVGNPVNDLDAAPKQYVDQILPVGIIMMYGGAVAPPGGRWALANGAELQTTEYPELFAVLGVAYGGSAGRFNLPNLTDKFPRGGAPGATGGTADAPIVTHTHTIDHTHPGVGTGNASTDHSHTMDFWSGVENQSHFHMEQLGTVIADGGDIPIRYNDGFTFPAQRLNTALYSTGWANQQHQHKVQGTSHGQSVDHYHAVTVPAFNGASAPPAGAVVATNTNLPPYVGVAYIVRVK